MYERKMRREKVMKKKNGFANVISFPKIYFKWTKNNILSRPKKTLDLNYPRSLGHIEAINT